MHNADESALHSYLRGGAELTSILNPLAVIDLYFSASAAALDDSDQRLRNVRAITTRLKRVVAPIQAVHNLLTASYRLQSAEFPAVDAAVPDPFSLARTPDVFPDVLDLSGSAELEFLTDCLGAMEEVFGPNGALDQLMAERSSTIDPLTNKIGLITPSVSCAGSEVLISLTDGAPSQRPTGLEVLFAPCGRVGEVTHWSETQVRVRVPKSARSGAVYFGRKPELTVHESHVGATIIDAAKACPRLFAGGQGDSIVQKILAFSTAEDLALCPDMFVDPNYRHRLTVQHAPVIRRLVAMTPDGAVLASSGYKGGSADPCQGLVLEWEIHNDAGVLDVKLTAPDGQTFTDLSPMQRFGARLDQTGEFKLSASNTCGEDESTLEVETRGHVTLAPLGDPESTTASGDSILRVVAGQPTTVALKTQCPVKTNVRFVIKASDATAIVVPPEVVLSKGNTTTTFPLRSRPGTALKPAGWIEVSQKYFTTHRGEVWSENVRGNFVDRASLDMMAIHAALLSTGHVLFWAGDEGDYNRIDLGRSQIWDYRTNTVETIPLNRNLFCSGHAMLPNGHVLVAGGHAFSWVLGVGHGAFFVGHGADHDVHVFDADKLEWLAMPKMVHSRWYPSCLALADGSVLIVSGAAAGAPGDPFYKGSWWTWAGRPMNREPEVVLSTGERVRGDRPLTDDWEFDLYPFLHLLPGGRIFMHCRRTTWLLQRRGLAEFWPQTDEHGGERNYQTNSLNIRTYPTPSR